MQQSVVELCGLAVKSLLSRFGEDLLAVVLFGSYARGEAAGTSDLDFFVVARNLPRDLIRRRYLVYDALFPLLTEANCDIKVIEADEEDIGGVITPLTINIAHDGVILYDKTGQIARFFERVNEAVHKAGLTRYRTPDGKYGWKLNRKLRPGEGFTVQLEGLA